MADRDELKSRLSAFGELPLPSRLHMFSDSANRESQNIEDKTDIGPLGYFLEWEKARLQKAAGGARVLYEKMRNPPWRKSVGEHIQGAGNMLPDLDLRRNFAEGGTVDDILSAYSAPVRSWPGEQVLDDEARANYAAMHPEPKKLRPDESFRGMFLPFRETTEGKHEWAVPGIFMDPADAAKAIHASSGTSLGAMARPSQISPEAIDEILGIGGAGALTGIMGNMPRVLAKPSAGMTELGIFGGRSAKTADQAALARAEGMAAEGAPREQIWKDTGWFQGPDGKWKFEIDDSGTAWRGPDAGGHSNVVKNYYPHSSLEEAYPDVPGMLVESPKGSRAAFYDTWPAIHIGGEVKDKGSSMLHELQHHVQEREGFAVGANPGMYDDPTATTKDMFARASKGIDDPFSTEAQAARDALWKTIDSNRDMLGIPTALYRMNAGEAEARAVQARQGLSALERRARAPWLDYDIPEPHQIVRYSEKRKKE